MVGRRPGGGGGRDRRTRVSGSGAGTFSTRPIGCGAAGRGSDAGLEASRGCSIHTRQRGRDLDRHAAPRSPGTVRCVVRDARGLAAGPGGRRVRPRSLAGSAHAALPRLAPDGVVSAAPRRARQWRLPAARGRHHPGRTLPGCRLQDGGVHLVVRAAFPLGHRSRSRGLRRCIRLRGDREPGAHGRRETRGAGRRGGARVAPPLPARRPSLLSLVAPLRSA